MPKPKKKSKGKDPPDLKGKPSSHRTLKTSLKSILLDPDHLQTGFIDLANVCNQIVAEAYQFIRLYCLYKFHRNEGLPKIDQQFILYCIRAIGIKNKTNNINNPTLRDELNLFYEREFKSLLTHPDKISLVSLTPITINLAAQMETAICNNLKVHFVTRLLRFINITAEPFDKNLRTKKEINAERKKLKDALFANDPEQVPTRYNVWMNTYRASVLPETWEKTLPYDVAKNPCRYLSHSFKMNSILENMGRKLFQPLSLRTSIVPSYMMFDTTSLINMCMSVCNLDEIGNKKYLLTHVKENQDAIWRKIFDLDHPIFKQRNYRFNYTIQSDGIGVSLLFVHKDFDERKKKENATKFLNDDNYPYPYVDKLSDSQLESLKDKTVVGADPGKFNLLYLADEDENGEGKKLRYTALQRRTETLTRRNSWILRHEKTKAMIEEKESTLSNLNSKSVNYEKFKEYLRAKNRLNAELRDFYERELFRKMKWRHYVHTRRSEDKFLSRIEKTFGPKEEICIAYGDWSRSDQMKNFIPTMGIGLRKLISKRFQTVNVNEFRTSKLCCRCHQELEYFVPPNNGSFLEKKGKVYRCLVCKECVSSESKNPVFVTRDRNSALNIRNLAVSWIREKKRPDAFCRARGELPSNELVDRLIEFK